MYVCLKLHISQRKQFLTRSQYGGKDLLLLHYHSNFWTGPNQSWKYFDLDSPPLVIAVDIPHHTLHKDLVFIHGWKTSYPWECGPQNQCISTKGSSGISFLILTNKCTKHERGKFLEDDRVAWLVSFENLKKNINVSLYKNRPHV